MTKSELFKAAHKLAKAWYANLGGDYIVYFAKALKGTIAFSKKAAKEVVFKHMNKIIKEQGGESLIMYTTKVKCTHGQHKFSHEYKMNNEARKLEKGHYFGKSWVSGGVIKVWEHSTRNEQRAY